MTALKRRTLLGYFLAMPVATACYALPTEFRCRFRIKAVLEAADSGVHTATSVIEVLWTKVAPGFTGISYTTSVWGEAPYVNVGGHGNVFVLLNPPSTYEGFSVFSIENSLRNQIGRELTTSEAVRDGRYLSAITALPGEYSVPKKYWPRLMTFSDNANLRSGRLVDDGGSLQVRIRDVTLAVTRDAVEHAIESVLPWLRQDMPLPQLGKVATDKIPFAYRVHKSCFLLKGEHP